MRPRPRCNPCGGPLRRSLLADERGAEVIEWALLAALVVIATIAIVGAVGAGVLARWTTGNGAL